MRIICPGCRAEYAIPDTAIPEAGREVQCAACTHAWYQLPLPPAREPARAAATASEDPSMAARSAATYAGPGADLRIERLRAAMGEIGRGVPPSPVPASTAGAGAGMDPPPDLASAAAMGEIGRAVPPSTAPASTASAGASMDQPPDLAAAAATGEIGWAVPPSPAPGSTAGAGAGMDQPPDLAAAAAMDEIGRAVPPSPAPASTASSEAHVGPLPDLAPAAARVPPQPAAAARRPAMAGAEDTDEEAAASHPAPEPATRRIDPDVLRILREEAAIEVRARTGQAPPAAVQRSPAQERLARLQAAERGGSPLGPADGEAAVEDPDAARRQPRPPLIAAANPGAEPEAGMGWPDQPLTARPRSEGRRDLMVRQSPGQLALVQAARRRRGFRMGYTATAGLCCALLALYVSAPVLAQWLPAGTPLAEMVIDHGDRVQAAVVDALRSVLEKQPGAS